MSKQESIAAERRRKTVLSVVHVPVAEKLLRPGFTAVYALKNSASGQKLKVSALRL